MGHKIRLSEPDIGEHEISAVEAVLKSGYLTQGDNTLTFERSFSSLVGADYALAVSSATAGLELALWSLEIEEGDEVIVPDFSWPATGNAVVAMGATPVFADINLDTFCIDVKHAESLISDRTRAIMPVHAFGHMADMLAINQLAENNSLFVVEDAACAFGSSQNGIHAGVYGDFGVFSFHPRKIITTGEGGIVLSKSPKKFEKAKLGRAHGATRAGRFAHFTEFGFNFRMTEMQAALGAVQVSRGAEIRKRTRKNAELLSQELGSIEWLNLPTEQNGFVHSFQSFVVLLDEDVDRNRIIDFLDQRGIEATLGTYSMASQPSFQRLAKEYWKGDLANSFRAYRSAMSLPMHSLLSEDDIHYIAQSMKSASVSVES